MLADVATYGVPAGRVLVHYATTGTDAALPGFVAEVAATAEAALTDLGALGFRAPLADGTAGGDDRVDIYLRDLQAADGNAGIDRCTAGQCIGYAVAENDFAGFSYPSQTAGIRAVVPHELFHLMQYAYSDAQPAAWTEGSAVWAVEQLYNEGSSDFERFLPAFLERNFRPFERTGGGFGDGYPYGAALWPYFLVQRYHVAIVADAWAASATLPALDAVGAALTGRGGDLERAWIEFTRWNWFTGARAAGGGYPAAAAAWPTVSVEPASVDTGMVYVEGMSARYLPLRVSAAGQRVVVTPGAGTTIAAWLLPPGGGLADGIELVGTGDALMAAAPPADYVLVVTGLARNTLPTAVSIATAPLPPAEPEPTPDGLDDGGCRAGRGSSSSTALVVLALAALPRSRRRRRQP